MIKQCARCGNEFETRAHNAKYCSDCRVKVRRESCRRWQKKHPEKVLEYQRQWRAANPEKAYEQVKRYRKRHPDVHYAQHKRWRKRHPDKARAQLYRWREKNREHYNAYMRHRRYIKFRAERLRAILIAKKKPAVPQKRERHWSDYVSLTPSICSTYIYGKPDEL